MRKCADSLALIFKQADVDATHGIEHALRVVSNCEKALNSHPALDDRTREMVLLAALLHDADDRKYFPTHSNYNNARLLL